MSDKPDVYMPLVLGDLLKHVRRIDRADFGSYIFLIMDYWINGPPPDDDKVLATIAGCTPAEWKMTRKRLAPYFQIRNGHWNHKRIEAELELATSKKERARKAGLASGQRRRDRTPSSTQSSTPSSTIRSSGVGLELELETNPSPSPGRTELINSSVPTGRNPSVLPLDGQPRISPEERAEVAELMKGLAATMGGKRARG